MNLNKRNFLKLLGISSLGANEAAKKLIDNSINIPLFSYNLDNYDIDYESNCENLPVTGGNTINELNNIVAPSKKLINFISKKIRNLDYNNRTHDISSGNDLTIKTMGSWSYTYKAYVHKERFKKIRKQKQNMILKYLDINNAKQYYPYLFNDDEFNDDN